MGIIVRTVVALPLLVFFSLTAWLGWTLVDPFLAEIAAEASDSLGIMDPVLMLISLVFRFAFPGLALAVIFWWVFGAIRVDSHHQQYQHR